MSTPSSLVADRYRLVKMIGAGGMGIVWQAWDERLHRPVALKMLRTQPELTDAERQQSTDRALREARITAGLRHPHAVTVFDVIEHDGQPCIVMELIESTPLSDLLSEHGTLTPAVAARIGAEVASALAAAHKLRIVHRDVKPGNILITADGSAMISDFGISHALGDATITATGLIHGTPAYLAPEVARGLPTSFASDVFSLGSTLYAVLEGAPPFGSDKNAIALLHKVARGGYRPPQHAGPLAPLLSEMLSTNPKRRPSMASVVASLSAVHQDSTPSAALPAGGAVAAAALIDGTPIASGDDVPTEAVEHGPPAASDPDVTTEAFEQHPPATTTVPVDAQLRPTLAPHTPTAQTIAADQPTRYQPPTAETEPLAGATVPARVSTGQAGVPPVEGAPPAERATSRRGRRRADVIVGLLVLLLGIAVGAAMLLNPLRPAGDAAGPTASQTPASSASPTPPAIIETPDPQATPLPPAASTPPSPEAEPAPPPTGKQRAIETISGYYAMLPGDLDSAWPTMTADYQENHAGGRGGYEAFWSTVDALEIADVSASAPDRAQATLTYHFRDGRVVQEVTSFQLVDEEGALKIAATDVLSSTQL
ncbi:protein kinase domain-containing protein [Microbacterium sp. P5_E9]